MRPLKHLHVIVTAAALGFSACATTTSRFTDGTDGMFVFAGYPPFRPGDAVVLTPQGVARM